MQPLNSPIIGPRSTLGLRRTLSNLTGYFNVYAGNYLRISARVSRIFPFPLNAAHFLYALESASFSPNRVNAAPPSLSKSRSVNRQSKDALLQSNEAPKVPPNGSHVSLIRFFDGTGNTALQYEQNRASDESSKARARQSPIEFLFLQPDLLTSAPLPASSESKQISTLEFGNSR